MDMKPEDEAAVNAQEFTLVMHGDEVIALQLAILFAHTFGHKQMSEKQRAQIKELSNHITRTK
jgi:hypothetical protein